MRNAQRATPKKRASRNAQCATANLFFGNDTLTPHSQLIYLHKQNNNINNKQTYLMTNGSLHLVFEIVNRQVVVQKNEFFKIFVREL
jgi:hypothetical protein